MTPNSAQNSDPRRRFFDLFGLHWAAGTGLDQKLRAKEGGWSYRRFADVLGRLGKSPPDPDTVAAWLKGTRWPKQSRRDVILAAFFPTGGGNEAERQALDDAWAEGERAPRSADANIAASPEDRLPPKWVRYDETVTEGLAELALTEPQPHSNEDGVFRIEGEPLVTVAEAEIDGRDLRIGVNSVLVLFDSASYAIRPDSLISKRRDDTAMKTVVGGVRFSAAEGKPCLDGPLWQGDYFAVIDSRNTGDGSFHVALRAARRSFRVAEIDAQGRRISVEATEEQNAVLNILLGQEQDKDTLGRVALAKVSMRRKSE
jgi:hypothetical protein